MPRKPKAAPEALPAAPAESAAPAPKKRVARKKTTVSASPAKTASARPKKSAKPARSTETTPKRAAKPKAPAKRVPAAKSHGTSKDVLGANSYHDDIARLAYHFWEQRGRVDGSPEEDWLRAEQEFRRTVRLESA